MAKTMLDTVTLIEIPIRLPAGLIRRAQALVDNGVVTSQNALFAAAIEHTLVKLEREELDRQFAAMANDVMYQQMNEFLATEFAMSDWEALSIEFTYDKSKT